MKRSELDISQFGYRVSSVLHEEAQSLFEQMRFDEAIAQLQHGIQDATKVADVDHSVLAYDSYLLLAQCYLWNGDLPRASQIASLLGGHDCRQGDDIQSWVLKCILSLVNDRYQEGYEFIDARIQECLANNDYDICEHLLYRGSLSLRMGLLGRARSDFSDGYALARLRQSLRLKAGHANFLGFTYLVKSDYRQAIHWYGRSREIGLEMGRNTQIGISALNQGICYYRMGDYPAALDRLNEALISLKDDCGTLNLCRTHIALACVHRWLRDFDTARQHLSQAYTMAGELTAAREECLALEFLGDVFRDEGNFSEARRYYKRGMAIAETIAPDGDLVGEILRRDGECLIHADQTGEGLEILARALAHVRKLGDRAEEGIVLRCLAEGFLQAGEHDNALTYAEEACAQLEELDARHEHAIARLVAGEILLRQSSVVRDREPRDLLDLAWNHSIIAQGIILKLGIAHWTEAIKQLQVQIVNRRQQEHRRQVGKASRFHDSFDDDLCFEMNLGSPQVVIAESQAMQEVLQTAEAYAPYDQTVLLTGETGTGKELIAHLLHRQSGRRGREMVTVNITSFSACLFDREFFGHARGAFTGADSDSRGLAAAADGGTLFLDEIGELPLEVQVKLLRLLQNGSYMRLGDPSQQRADLRIIASTNRDLKTAIKEGRFRKDLYYRLASLSIHIPPLRKRREDILPLMDRYLSLSAKQAVTVERYFNEVSQKLLVRYGWPGNVREVIQVAHQAHVSKQRLGRVEVVLGDGPDSVMLTGPGARAKVAVAGGKDRRSLSRAHVLLALEESGGNRSEAARKLGISRTALYRQMDKFGISD